MDVKRCFQRLSVKSAIRPGLFFDRRFARAATLAQTTAFTYQGKLSDGGNAATGQYDFQFKLFDTDVV
jgi:hypothetical protein